ncbi:MAG: response regulator [Nitrospinae bacterium]|nr:response regulator [Nitrospinota bacterium]
MTDALILLVDDTESNLELLEMIFEGERAKTLRAAGGEKALELAKKHGAGIDLIITDIRMPYMDGIQLTGKLRELLGHQTPIMLLTAERKTDEQLSAGLQAGANDYLIKPINEVELLARSGSLVRLKRVFDENMELQRSLELKVIERTIEVEMSRDATMFALAKQAEFRDPETGSHLERIREYVRLLAAQMQKTGPYQSRIDHTFVMNIYKASPLHDIGKVGIPDRILLKPGRLDPDEFEIMKQHAAFGGRTLHEAEERLLAPNQLLTMAKEIAFCHHEKWDGSGYPGGIKGEEIPLPARIMALADVYDALTSKRVYKSAMSHEETHAIIAKGKGTHFDPVVIDAYESLIVEFVRIRDSFKDAG